VAHGKAGTGLERRRRYRRAAVSAGVAVPAGGDIERRRERAGGGSGGGVGGRVAADGGGVASGDEGLEGLLEAAVGVVGVGGGGGAGGDGCQPGVEEGISEELDEGGRAHAAEGGEDKGEVVSLPPPALETRPNLTVRRELAMTDPAPD
jgi:hypothetical protein